ncbi:hypothetical protein IWW39_002188 [Coemansia spiralis]|uniref:Protein kinase domain-containing protein n=1 Tax=Coemansia spiralis TaxID=417178 RepID=A0A9W8L5U0_9FUNG|nr:hypothetical protein IWW39_002188 [Coemansia spiralis]
MTYCSQDQSTRRSELAQSLQGRGHHLDLGGLLKMLALSDSFNKYMSFTSNMMLPVAQIVPALVGGQLLGCVESGQPVQATSASLAWAFRGIWNSVRLASQGVYGVADPASECRFSDERSMQAGGARVKPDGVFYYPAYFGNEFHSVHALLEARVEPSLEATSPDVLGKMAYLALRAWEAQPTRLFVPFLYLHGPNVSLVLFARGGYYCTTIGRLFHTSCDPSLDDIRDVGDTLRYLWFLMTLPADRFGHFVDVSIPGTGLTFSRVYDTANPSVVMGRGDGSALDYLQRIPLPVSLLDFQSYLFKTQYHGQPAMLKLVWTPTYRLPEVSMYDWLLSNGCNAVPKVLESSIVASDVFGYRLEYIVMEDCGVPLLEYFRTVCGSSGDISKRDADAEDIFKQLASSLAVAESLGVAHCDISTENITVRDGTAFIIDWTRSQLNSLEVPSRVANVLWFKLGLDAKNMQPQRWPMDNSVVQTKIYASIRSLWHDGTDCLVDRFESLFYVILHALFHSNHILVGTPSAFEELSVSAMALVKTGCMADPEIYPSYFGIADIGDGLKAFLDSIRVFLFCADGFFVGGKLVDSGFERSVRPDLARAFLSEAAYAATYAVRVVADREPPASVAAKPFFAFSFPSGAAPLQTAKFGTAAVSAASATGPTVVLTTAPVVPATAPPVLAAVTATLASQTPLTPVTAPAVLISAPASAPAVLTTAPASIAPASMAPVSAAPVSPAPAPAPSSSIPATASAAPIAVAATSAPVLTPVPAVASALATVSAPAAQTTAPASSAPVAPAPAAKPPVLASATVVAPATAAPTSASPSAAAIPAAQPTPSSGAMATVVPPTVASAASSSAPTTAAPATPAAASVNPLFDLREMAKTAQEALKAAQVVHTSASVTTIPASSAPATQPLSAPAASRPPFSFDAPNYSVPLWAPGSATATSFSQSFGGFSLGLDMPGENKDTGTWTFGSKRASKAWSASRDVAKKLHVIPGLWPSSSSTSAPATAPAVVGAASSAPVSSSSSAQVASAPASTTAPLSTVPPSTAQAIIPVTAATAATLALNKLT